MQVILRCLTVRVYLLSQVMLTLQKVCNTSMSKPGRADGFSSLSKQASDGPVKLVAGERLSKPVLSLDECPHAAMYLTMDINSEHMQDKVGLIDVISIIMKMKVNVRLIVLFTDVQYR